MFSIDTGVLKRSSKQLYNDSEALLKNKTLVTQVCDDLRGTSDMTDVIETLEYIAGELTKEAGNVNTLAEAADRIAFKYESTEMRILEEVESVSEDTPKGNVKFGDYNNTDNMNPGVRDTFGDIDKLIK